MLTLLAPVWGGPPAAPAAAAQAAATQAGATELPMHLVVVPDETWRAARWPLVVALPDSADLEPLYQQLAALTANRGALLVVVRGGDVPQLEAILAAMARQHPVQPGATLLITEGALVPWAVAQARAHTDQVAGVIALNPAPPPADLAQQVPDKPDQAPTQSVIVLITQPGSEVAGRRLIELLRGPLEFEAAAATVPDQRLPRVLGAALSALLPATPARSELFDAVTGVRVRAPRGWLFERHDRLWAVARPVDAGDDGLPVLELANGALGDRDFAAYVAATRQALQVDGIELLQDEAMPVGQSTWQAHVYRFTDHRGDREQQVLWVQVGTADGLISLRYVAPPGPDAPTLDLAARLLQAIDRPQPLPPAAGSTESGKDPEAKPN